MNAHRTARVGTPLPRPVAGAPGEPRLPGPIRTELPNGLDLMVIPKRGLPQVAMRLVVPAGAAADPEGRHGAAAFVGAMLTEGTYRRSAEELNRALDHLGASLGVHTGHDFVEIDLTLLAETLEPGIELLAELVTAPAFPEREMERVRSETLDTLVARLDEPANVADDRLAAALFGAHPYGRLTTGTPDGVRALDRRALDDLHAAYYRPAGSVLVVSGEVDATRVERLAAAALGAWSGAAAPIPYPAVAPEPVEGRGMRIVEPFPDSSQAELRVGGIGMPRDSEDWIPAAVANYLVGGSTITGRLGANLREDKGWTYGVRSGFAAARQAGAWVVETAVDVEVAADALDEIRGELDRFMIEPPAESELRRAKEALVLSLPRVFETPGRIVARYALLPAYGLPDDYWERFAARVQAVTPGEALAAARRYFHPDRLAWLAVGPGRDDS